MYIYIYNRSYVFLLILRFYDDDFYFEFEVHFGGCGGLFTTASGSGTRAALGLPFKLHITVVEDVIDSVDIVSLNCIAPISHMVR
jgi:hypothetical protein